jgi:hypothetical protein
MKLVRKVLGFLGIRGWEGVENVYLFVGVGVAIGMSLVYYLLVYRKMEMPRRITIRGHLVKIALLLALLYFLWRI